MKRPCPMCAEEIQANARLCKHCKSAVKPRRIGAKLGWLMTFALLVLGLYYGARHVDPAAGPSSARALADQAAAAGRKLLESR